MCGNWVKQFDSEPDDYDVCAVNRSPVIIDNSRLDLPQEAEGFILLYICWMKNYFS